jgi:hypothetical protein
VSADKTSGQDRDGLLYKLRFLKKRGDDWKKYWLVIAKRLSDLDGEQLDIVKLRWFEETKDFDLFWRRKRVFHYCFRVPTIIGAATVPVLAGLSASRYATAVVGLVVAVLAGLDSFFQVGTRWQQQRRSADQLGFEGWQFVELSGDYETYETHTDAYKLFLKRLERLNLSLSEAYVASFHEPAAK